MKRFIGLILISHFGLAAAIAPGGDDSILTPQKKAHWAWHAPLRPAVPSVKQAARVHNPIDAFVLAQLEVKGLTPAPPADPATLLRRLYFDLIGLPPTPTEVDEFVAAWDAASAKRQAVLEKVVDHLLASPHYGERWGRHWLDLVRYAESRGHEFDFNLPNAHQYRDYVIRAFNADVPYDQFLREHLAGDLLPAPRLHPQAQ